MLAYDCKMLELSGSGMSGFAWMCMDRGISCAWIRCGKQTWFNMIIANPPQLWIRCGKQIWSNMIIPNPPQSIKAPPALSGMPRRCCTSSGLQKFSQPAKLGTSPETALSSFHPFCPGPHLPLPASSLQTMPPRVLVWLALCSHGPLHSAPAWSANSSSSECMATAVAPNHQLLVHPIAHKQSLS